MMPLVYTRSTRRVPIGPDLFFAALPDLFLPDRDDLLKAVDEAMAGLERRLAVRRRYGGQQGGLANLQAAGPVLDCNLSDGEALAPFVGDLLHHLRPHLRNGVVFPGKDARAEIVVGHDARPASRG